MFDSVSDFFYEVFHSTIGKVVLGAAVMAMLFLALQRISILGQTNSCRDLGGDYIDGKCTIEDDSNEYAKNIIIVAGNTANTPKPQISTNQDSEEVYDYIKKSILKHEKINVKMISAASDKASKTIEIEKVNLSGVEKVKETITSTIESINSGIGKAPKSDGAAYYEAIVKAARAAASYKDSNESVVIVFGSGLSDSGVINFAKDKLLFRSASDVILALDKANQLDGDYLEGVRIKWYGIGQTMEPQEDLSPADVEKTKAIYRTALEKLGAEVEFYDYTIDSATIEDNKHTVVPTPVSEVTIDPVEFGDDELSFSADNTQISDEGKAEKALADVIEKARANSSKKIVVTGYMAAGTCNPAAPKKPELSSNRANAVKQFLVSKGITNGIEVRDGGVFNPSESECSGGSWRSELADYRRKVVIEFK